MAMKAGTLLIVFAIIAAVIVGAVIYQKKQHEHQAVVALPASSGPPAGAQFLLPKHTALFIMSSVSGAKDRDRDAVAADFIGKWVPEPGWTGEIKEVKVENDGQTSLRMWMTTPSTFMGGGFWVVAVIPGPDPDITTKDNVWVQGVVDNIQVLNDGSPIPMCRIVLKECRPLLVQRIGR
jgi:hypothetical protein